MSASANTSWRHRRYYPVLTERTLLLVWRVSEASVALGGYLTGRSVASDPHQLSAYLSFFSAPRWGCLAGVSEGIVRRADATLSRIRQNI